MRIIAGHLKNRRLNAPKGMETRPTSERLRETVFNICQTYIEGAHFLDLFGGSGAIGIEAISRGAVHATFIDSNKESIQCIKKNIEQLKLEHCTKVICGDVLGVIDKMPNQSFDIIFVDPPYGRNLDLEVMKKIDDGSLLKGGGMLFIERALKDPIEATFNTLVEISSRNTGKSTLLQYQKT